MPFSMLEDLIGQSDSVLAAIDPLELNLLVARGLPACRDLPIESYERKADGWTVDLASRVAGFEDQFHESPDAWKNDIRFFRLGVLCWYLAEVLGIRYREDQRELQSVSYTDPDDLFLHGVMDTRQGTCGNLAALHVAIAWRLGWPLHLACAGPHIFCRYDDGEVVHNIEATNNSQRGFQSHPDEHYQESRGVPDVAIKCGSDLRALSPRQMLGLFIGLRGRHREDLGLLTEAEADYLLARTLFPENRRLYTAQVGVSVQLSDRRFNVGEAGHYTGLARWLRGESNQSSQASQIEAGFAINVGGRPMVAMKEPSGAALAVGRLTGWEPLGFEAGDNNWYRFVANGPAGKTDPGGLWAWDGDWIQMGVGGLLGVYGTGVAVAGWSQIDEGAAATIDGLIPVIDPFASYYADECGHISDVYRQSQAWGSTAAVLFTAASGFAAWSAVGGGQFAVGIAAGSAGSWVPHVTYGYGAGGVYTWAHGVGAAGFTTTSFAGPGIVNVTGIPILFPGAIAAWIGAPGTRPDVGNCVYSCGQAFFQGWWPF